MIKKIFLFTLLLTAGMFFIVDLISRGGCNKNTNCGKYDYVSILTIKEADGASDEIPEFRVKTWCDNLKVKYKKIIKEIPPENAESNGPWSMHFKNGAVESEGINLNGKFNGPVKFYYSNGTLRGNGFFIKGKCDGTWKLYTKDGIIYSETNYKNGRRDGISKSYNKDGTLRSKITYKDGKIIDSHFTAD